MLALRLRVLRVLGFSALLSLPLAFGSCSLDGSPVLPKSILGFSTESGPVDTTGLSLQLVRQSAVQVRASIPAAASTKRSPSQGQEESASLRGNSEPKAPVLEIPLSDIAKFSIQAPQVKRELVSNKVVESSISNPEDRAKISLEEISALVVNQDGSRAYSGGSDGSVFSSTIIKPESANKQGFSGLSLKVQLLASGTRPILALALSPNQKKLAIAQFSAVFILDLEKGYFSNVMTKVNGRLISLAWDPRGELLAFGRVSGEAFVWNLVDGKDAGRNSLNAIEQYGRPGNGPIFRLAFHPSGRAFIAAEQSGDLTLWRLLRTERELGLRDESAAVDDDRIGSKQVSIAKPSVLLEDLWFDGDGDRVYVSGVDGRLYNWRIRGVERGSEIEMGPATVRSIQGGNFETASGRVLPLLFGVGRGQKLSVFCRNISQPLLSSTDGGVPIIHNSSDAESASDANQTAVVDGRLVIARQLKKTPAQIATSAAKRPLLAETPVMEDPLHIIRSGSRSAVLWGAQKKGNLLLFNAQPLLSSLAGHCPQS